MILDKKEHRDLLLEMINGTKFPGFMLETILELKKAVVEAKIAEKKAEEDDDG